jgi:asparagine synthase (glutamine-hydrolysing)
MCGIAGLVGADDAATMARMVDVQRHRGPDDAGVSVFAEERVLLGHRRLSIIDLSPAGHQPMRGADDAVWIVFNGEVYNFPELRRELEAVGARFESRTDTEVVLRLYEREGPECVRRLNGMFAFAILDRRRRKLLLARDHLGIKPLYYYHGNGRFVFGSEIKAILASGVYSADVNWQGLSDYFTYLYVPCPETIYRGIFQVPPAHALELDLPTNELRLWQYWRLENGGAAGAASDGEAKEVLRGLLADSVRRQMVSDVPLGIFLSGGVDSPILTGLMAQASARPVRTFTVVFHGRHLRSYDEGEAARAVARRFGTAHSEIAVDIGDPMAMLRLVEFFDQPFGNPTFYLMYLISKHTRAETKVALCGAGGDELFAGYPRYRAMGLARWLRRVPAPLLAGARHLAGASRDRSRGTTLSRVRRLLDGLDEDFARQFVKWTYFLDEGEKRRLLGPRVRETAGRNGGLLPADRVVRRYLAESPLEDFGNRVLHLDVQTFLPDNLLEYTDKMSMAASLEVRVPYLDPRVVEASFAIPFRQKLRGAQSKVVLKEAFADLLPEVTRHAPKRGFVAPLAIWMRESLDRYFDRCMGRAEVEREGIFNWEYLQLLREAHRAGRADTSHELFAVIMFDVWYKRYVLGAAEVVE